MTWSPRVTGTSTLTIGLQGALIGATSYDRTTGIALFPLPHDVSLTPGTLDVHVVASDYQESKNIDTVGPSGAAGGKIMLTYTP